MLEGMEKNRRSGLILQCVFLKLEKLYNRHCGVLILQRPSYHCVWHIPLQTAEMRLVLTSKCLAIYIYYLSVYHLHIEN